MGKIKQLREDILFGSNSQDKIYPVTSTKAVYDTSNKVLDDYIQHLKKTSTFAGIATPTTNPGTPNGNVFYLASEAGVYTNFSGITINTDEIAILVWNNGATWKKEFSGFASSRYLVNEVARLDKKIDDKKSEINVAKEEALQAIAENEQSAITNFNAQRVTPEMLSESTKQLIEASGGGTITNLADDEDLTSVDDGTGSNVLKLADRTYNADNFSGKGYKILRKNVQDGKNILTQDMINESNIIYEIRYDFDLNSKTISLPKNSTLKFVGGSISNGTLIGNNTKIIADKNEQIFRFDRSSYYVGGTWRIDKWYCAWFGTVADGKAYKAKYNNLGELEKTSESGYFEVLIEGTDNFEPIQEALDAAYNTNIRVVELGLGSYRIAKPLNIGWGGYKSIYFKGIKNGHFGDITESNNESTFILCDTETYGICINQGSKTRLSDFDILGWNGINYRKNFTAWQNTKYYVEKPEDWNSERVNKLPNHGLEPMSPYAGIVTDAFINYSQATNPYELPTPPVNVTTFKPKNSSGLTVERVNSNGFCVGFGLEVGAYQDNADFFKFYNCDFSNNVYGFATGSSQARNTALHECGIELCYTAITNTKVGKRSGGLFGYISNCWFDRCYRILEWKADVSPIVFYNCYCENGYMIGSSSFSAIRANSVKFIDCNFKLNSGLANPLGLPSCYFSGPAFFVRTTITLDNDGILVPLFMANGCVDNCTIIGKASNATFYSTREVLFNPYSSERFKISQVVYSDTLNRLNQYANTIGSSPSSIVQLSDTAMPKQLKHTSYSYNEDTRILTLETNWIGTTAAGQKTICVGDIIFQKYTNTVYVIIKITPSKDNNTATLLCTPIQGFRKTADNKYVCRSTINANTLWTVYSTRLQAFNAPLIVANVNGKEITLKNWSTALKAGVVLSRKHDYEHSFQFESGLIESVDSSQKKITLKYGNGINDAFKVINGYMLAEEDANFWEGTWVQDFIDSQKA